MIFKVELLAFGEPGEIREVTVPDIEHENSITQKLDKVYHWGQNDFQPQQHPSVSCGDIVQVLDDKNNVDRFMICRFGFRQITEAQYQEYLLIPRRDRFFSKLLDEPTI